MSKDHTRMNQRAWDAAHKGWFESKSLDKYYAQYARREHDFDDTDLELFGDLTGKDVLQLSCAGDASQAFSLKILGANVTACDFSPVAIDIARENAVKHGLQVEFVVADSQRLEGIPDNSYDWVHADYNLWYYEDLPLACRNWHRVLRPGGRLFLHEEHPITAWCLTRDDETDRWRVQQSYNDPTPEYYSAASEESGPLSYGDPELEAVEFPYTLADILNAVFQSGLRC